MSFALSLGCTIFSFDLHEGNNVAMTSMVVMYLIPLINLTLFCFCHFVALGNAKLRGASQLLRLAVYCLSPGIEYFEQKEARTYGNAPREKVGTGHAVYLGKKSFHLFALGIGGGMRERIVVIALFLGRTERKPAKLRIVGAHTLQNGLVIGKEQYIS